MVLLRILLLLMPVYLFGQIGYDPKPAKTWFKDTVLNTKAVKINSQGGLIVGGYNLNSDAVLEVSSTTKTFLPPRMTGAQRIAIGSPTNGAIVFDTDSGKICFYNSGWTCISNTGSGGSITATNGLTKSNDTILLGGDLIQPTIIYSHDQPFVITTDTGTPVPSRFNIFHINKDNEDILSQSVSDSCISSFIQTNTETDISIALPDGVVSELVIDTSQGFIGIYDPDSKLSYKVQVYSDKPNSYYDAEMNVLYDDQYDVTYLAAHYGRIESFVSDTPSQYPRNYQSQYIDSNVRVLHGTNLGNSNYSLKIQEDTVVTFSFDSGAYKYQVVPRQAPFDSCVIIHDAAGNAYLKSLSSFGGGGWSLTGNAGLTDGVDNLLGTTDDIPLRFLVGGVDAGRVTYTGENTALGSQALTNVSAGTQNTAYGAVSLVNLTSGTFNTAIGHSAGNVSTGNDNVFLGANTTISDPSYNNCIVAGKGANASLADQFAIGTQTHLNFPLNSTGSETGYVLTNTDGNGIADWQPLPSPIISSGATAPASAPAKVGDIYIDTVGLKLYFATGTASSADWIIAN